VVSAFLGYSHANVHRVAARRQDHQVHEEGLLLSSHAPPLRLHLLLSAVLWARLHTDTAYLLIKRRDAALHP
jgi:hypothetical protein